MMIKKTLSVIGFVLLTFCFGLGIAGLLPSDAKAGFGPPILACDLGICFTSYASDCPPGEFKTITSDGRRGTECCGSIISISGCNPPQ